jgi:hypothetical protein
MGMLGIFITNRPNNHKMVKHLFTICCIFIAISQAQAQTLHIKSNSAEDMQIIAIGTDKDGHTTSRTFYDFGGDDFTTISFYKAKYGYDAYNNKEMIHDGYDPDQQWTKLMIYDGSNTLYGTLDLTKATDRASIGNAKVWAKVKWRHDRDYLVTYVTLNDD